MGRKRKAGFASVLSSLPPDVKLSFAPKPSNTEERELPAPSHIDTEDLIVQRVHITRSTPTAVQVLEAEIVDTTPDESSTPARKKQKTSESHPVPSFSLEDISTNTTLHYKNQKSVPQHLKKYFAQRHRFFSLYDEGCLLDEEGWYSVTPEKIALQIAERCRCDTVIDAFCGVGGNAIAFAQTCERVIALDISPTRLAIARHNAVIYGVADRIEFILGDYVSFARSLASLGRRVDVVFLSPPWGGPSYISGPTDTEPSADPKDSQSSVYTLDNLLPISGVELFNLSHKISRNVAMYLPRNTDVGEIGALAPPGELVEIEEEWMGSKLKALTCYFGGLARGQSHLFDD
ncbi:S-adenosyl-L-methionine-dependent methyltransferase [Rhizoctonia solani AG-3 Rhs1AP]|uniref:Trimethylguanosine synthase n=2 Tax=Rhizoctonia solani AG-3 TaxID=1086053 RepID=A0A074S2S9_9AGAM|nr:S-adenosyl-L-methionine-dependent methyltransferase [Rhizoctonia solani AG-3 Rhs1AP]KEP53656.1 S-adenosyl-L-methionine-dependent methyltransferase [Rhizoctonia solani 123E]